MNNLRVFVDYECPYCKYGYEDLMAVLPDYPGLEIEWRPVEAHPRPEDSHPHTDLCIQAYYIALELGADMDAFHRALYQGVAIEKRNVEKSEVLAEILQGIVDSNKFLEILASKKYSHKVDENNDLAYEKSGVWYVPAFRVPDDSIKNAPRLDAKGGVGVNREEIREFLDKVKGNNK